jgi:hypothetical protein
MPVETGFLDIPANLSDIGYSHLDAEDIVKKTITDMETNYPGLITDFNKSQVAMMLLNASSKMAERLTFRAELLVKNNLISTTRHRPTGAKILEALGYEMGRPLAASGVGRMSLNQPLSEDVIIEPGTQISINGDDGNSLFFEFFKKDLDQPIEFESQIIIPQGQSEITNLVCIEGQTFTETFDNDSDLEYPTFVLDEIGALDDYFKVTVNGIVWERVEKVIFKSDAGRYYEVRHLPNGETVIKFGNGLFGAKPNQGDEISITYRIGGGERGLVVSDYFNVSLPIFVGGSVNRTVSVAMSNASETQGGADEETLNHARIYGPKFFAAQGKGGTGEDYTTISNLHTSSLGSVMKAVATHRGMASATGTNTEPFNIGANNKLMRITTLAGTFNVELTEGSRTAQEVADDITQAGINGSFKGEIYNGRVIVVSIQDDDVNVKLTLEQTSFSAYYELGLAEGHYAQWGSRHVDVYAFARGPADENGIPTAVNMSDLQKDELKTKLSKQDTKMLTDEIDIKDAQHNLVDIEAVVQVNKGVNIQTVEQAVMKSIYDFFNPELWEFGQRLNTVEIEKAIYNAASGIEDIILVNPQTAIESASYQLISKGNLNITFEYVV